jgi:hypothetical protein
MNTARRGIGFVILGIPLKKSKKNFKKVILLRPTSVSEFLLELRRMFLRRRSRLKNRAARQDGLLGRPIGPMVVV